MAKNKNKIHIPKKVIEKDVSASMSLVLMMLILLMTAFAFSPAADNELTNWDDHAYVVDNIHIRDLSADGIKNMFNISLEGNYHPLTLLSLAMDYKFAGLNPKWYHIHNIILHAINALLVFWLIRMISSSIIIAFVTAILFAIHPMHVESVAWVSERKDVLFAMFYLASAISYMYYLAEKKLKYPWYFLSLILFSLSVLSKATAVTLPVLLIAIQYFREKKFSVRFLTDKIIFVLISLAAGIAALQFQQSAIQGNVHFEFFDRIFFAAYGTLIYLIKAVVPYNLSAFYPYPEKTGGVLGLQFYAAVIPVLILAFYLWKIRNTAPYMVFGFLFFAITIALVIQVLPVGDALLAERYSYLPYIGLFFIAGFKAEEWWKKSSSFLKNILLAGFAVYCVTLVFVTRARCDVWQNSFTLWDDTIEKFPDSPSAHFNRANAHKEGGQLDAALAGYNKTIELNKNYKEVFTNRGTVLFQMGKMEAAMADLNRAVKRDSTSAFAYNGRGAVFYAMRKLDSALSDFNKAIYYKKDLADAYNNRATILSDLDQHGEALRDYNTYLKYQPEDYEIYGWRAWSEEKLGKENRALEDYSACISHGKVFGMCYIGRAKIFFRRGEYLKAYQDLQFAKKMGVAMDESFFEEVASKVR